VRADEIEALEASFAKEPSRVDLERARDAASRARDALALAPDDNAIEERRARFLATAADRAGDLKKPDLALALRLEAVDAARNAAWGSPARASAQGTLALKLLDAARALDTAPVATGTRAERSMRALELRNEGEGRLALAFTLGPTFPDLMFSAGSYYLYKTAATGKRADFELAREYLLGACALQSDKLPNYRAGARRLLELEKPRLGTYADELGAALEDSPRK
jgi:hypothetical protein